MRVCLDLATIRPKVFFEMFMQGEKGAATYPQPTKSLLSIFNNIFGRNRKI